MNDESWREWLDKVPDTNIEGFEDKVHEWVDQDDCMTYGHMANECLLMFAGDNPKRWLDVAYETISMCCCLREDEAVELLMRLYGEVLPELSSEV